MFNRHLMRMAFLALSIFPYPGAALAQSTMVSGGSSLAQPLFQDEINSLSASLFKAYAGRGSGAGLAAFLRNDAAKLGSAGAVHWIVSEALLSQQDVDDYLTDGPGKLDKPSGHGPLIQIPAAYTPITISYKGPAQHITLDRRQVCGVFSGELRKWSQLGVTVPSGLDDFTVVFRSQASGTTELLTRHLQAVCGQDSSVRFSGKPVFAEEFPGGNPPTHFVAADGESGLVAEMARHASAITYIGPDPALAAGLKPAWLVNSYDAVAYLPTPANVILAVEADGAALPRDMEPVRRPGAPGWNAAGNPGNPVNWIRLSPNPPRGYPIVGSLNLVLSQCYADPAMTRAIKALLKRHYSGSEHVFRHQLAPLSTAERARLAAAFLTAADGRGLDVGNPKVCADVAGRN